MTNRAIVSCVCFVLAVVFFTIPLFLKYQVYKPTYKYLVTGDVIVLDIDQISTAWCQGIELESNSAFRSFAFNTEPEVKVKNTERTISNHKVVLYNKEQEYWGFNLLRGSVVNVSACSRLRGGAVSVVKGKEALDQCLKEHRIHISKLDSSEENSPSESESDQATSSISSSQGVVANETDTPYTCKSSINHADLHYAYNCIKSSHSDHRKYAMTLYVPDNGVYYFVFSTKNYLEVIPNELYVNLVLDRTQFDLSSNYGNCSKVHHCYHKIGLTAEPTIIAQLVSKNGTLTSDMLVMACKARESFFVVFYVLFLLTVFLCAFQ